MELGPLLIRDKRTSTDVKNKCRNENYREDFKMTIGLLRVAIKKNYMVEMPKTCYHLVVKPKRSLH